MNQSGRQDAPLSGGYEKIAPDYFHKGIELDSLVEETRTLFHTMPWIVF